jgi:signal transduction histidine kinase
MHRPHELPSALNANERQISVGFRFWAVSGILVLAGMWLTDAPVWGCILAVGVWFQGAWLGMVWRHSRNLSLHQLQTTLTPAGANVAAVIAEPEPVASQTEAAAAVSLSQQKLSSDDLAPLGSVEQDMLRYALSHDLRAPLRVIDGFTRIVKEDYGHHLGRLGHDHLERVLAA